MQSARVCNYEAKPQATSKSFKPGVLRANIRILTALITLVLCFSLTARGDEPDPIAPFKDAIRDARNQFRTNGLQGAVPYASVAPIESGLQGLADRSTGAMRARSLLELGRTQRISVKFTTAITNLTEAAELASVANLPDIAFDAWTNVARAHVIGTHDYGAASDAIDHAEAIAGDHPSQKQRFDLADLRSILYEDRGEGEAALIEAVTARQFAGNQEDRYYAEMDIADSLSKIFDLCQFRAIIDAKSLNDRDPRWGACNRAMSATHAAYDRAATLAAQLGWSSLVDNARRQIDRAEMLYDLWTSTNDKMASMQRSNPDLFHPLDASSVYAHQFWSPATTADLPDAKSLGPIIDQTIAERRRVLGDRLGARNLAMLAGRPGTNPDESARLLYQAVEVLQSERSSFFDARRRGTAIEDYSDIPVSLAMQLLSLHREAAAFDTFESIRARGLGELSQVLGQPDMTYATRRWLADVLMLDARASRIETRLVENVIATGDPTLIYDQLAELQAIRGQRKALISRGDREIARLRSASYQPAHLAELQAAARDSGVPVMLYWCDGVSLIEWYVGPNGTEVRSVFLPDSELRDKVRRVRESAAENPSNNAGRPFEETAARELYLFLISPFEHLLDAKQIMIVPAGPLVDLPFETLLMPKTGTPLIERWVVSYAPSATLALRALRQPMRPTGKTTAVFDPELDQVTMESTALRNALGPTLDEVTLESLIPQTSDVVTTDAADTTGLHLLLHGRFDDWEPLMSEVFTQSRKGSISAAEMVGMPLRGLHLAVLSGCETGRVGVRLSNEIYGFPWALLAGGVGAAVVSRWQIRGTSNEEWMSRFYSAIMAGRSPAQAGAEAMRDLRRTPKYAHPYYWAAMQVSGR